MDRDEFERRARTTRIAAMRARIRVGSLKRSLLDCESQIRTSACAHSERIALAELAERKSKAAFSGAPSNSPVITAGTKPEPTNIQQLRIRLQYAGACERLRTHSRGEAARFASVQRAAVEQRSDVVRKILAEEDRRIGISRIARKLSAVRQASIELLECEDVSGALPMDELSEAYD